MITNVTFEEFYRIIQRNYEGNNHVYKVKVELYDGPKAIQFVFTTPEGFVQDQTIRRGSIEILLEKKGD